MNTIIIDDPMVYQGGEMFAKQNHVSLKELVNNYVASLAANEDTKAVVAHNKYGV